MIVKAAVPQAERTGYDSACIKIFGGNISYVCYFTFAKLQKQIVDMCIYITYLAQPSCFLKLIFHMKSMQMQMFIACSIKCFGCVFDSEVQMGVGQSPNNSSP
jgi:hypothetical protein